MSDFLWFFLGLLLLLLTFLPQVPAVAEVAAEKEEEELDEQIPEEVFLAPANLSKLQEEFIKFAVCQFNSWTLCGDPSASGPFPPHI